ncbi:unnamed protein product [Zymoseptoria tritici ST99CH_3D1]|nr:unnamed protein product [Zymoseptoria tritici ST99CH_3D1]
MPTIEELKANIATARAARDRAEINLWDACKAHKTATKAKETVRKAQEWEVSPEWWKKNAFGLRRCRSRCVRDLILDRADSVPCAKQAEPAIITRYVAVPVDTSSG